MSDYSKFVIVAEDELYSGRQGRKISIYNTIWEIKVDNSGIYAVSCNKLIPRSESCHAEVLYISNTATIAKGFWKSFKAAECAGSGWGDYDSVVIRILEEKQKFVNQFEDRSAADVTFVVNGEECRGDRKHLAGISPVFNTMLYGKFAEAQQDKIVLEGIESAEIFKDFLLAVSPLRIQPNPSNVVALLELAHQYDIPFLMRNCEDHLMQCYEISIIDRLLLARKYDLNALELRIMERGLSKHHFLEQV
ncbi:BTB/POZ domain-containing protein [Ditylenchus destructor]|nr:BTB/POZ domain-containing protein [Ditylenchus destructor]